MIFFFGASLFMVNICAYAQTTYYTTAGIPESSTLTLRAWPSHASQPIANIPHNSTEIIPTGKNILLNENNWLQVAFENQVGWVESAYVAELPTQAVTQHEQPIEHVATQETEATTYTEPTTVYEQYSTAPEPAAIPWSESADSIYQDPNRAKTQPTEVITTTHSVVVIPTGHEEIDLREEGVTHSRYSSIDTAISVQYDQF